MLEVEGQPSGLGWLPDGDLLVVSMKDRRVLRRAADGTVTEHADVSALTDRPPQRHDRRPRRAAPTPATSASTSWAAASPATAALVRDRPRRQRERRGRGPLVPQRHGHHRRRHADRRRDVRRPLHRLHDRGRRRADRSPRLGAGPADARAAATPRRCSAPSPSRPTAARWTPRGTSGRPTRSPARSARVAPGGEIVEEIAMPDGLGVFACGLGGEDGRTLVACAAPDFHEEAAQGGARGGAAQRPPSTSRTRACRRRQFSSAASTSAATSAAVAGGSGGSP